MALVCVEDYEQKAKDHLEKKVWDYYRSGAGSEFTLKLNSKAFESWRLRPRYLRDVAHVCTDCEILGSKLSWPVSIAPTAMQKMAHADGEIGSAIAAGKAGSIYVLSTLSTTSIEDVAAAAPETCKWFQLYIYKDRSVTLELVQRAERANFKALLVTVDAPVFGLRRADLRNNFSLPAHLKLSNFTQTHIDSVFSDKVGSSGLNEYVAEQFDASITWQDVVWLRQHTKLPIVLKGILTCEDAILARDYGCAGVVVSNHGGRQLDSVVASIEALPEIVQAVGNDLIVMMDGGVVKGSDVFKALALGAKMVFVGRPVLWALACNGQSGVEHMLSLMKCDFENTMRLVGCQKLSGIQKSMMAHKNEFINFL